MKNPYLIFIFLSLSFLNSKAQENKKVDSLLNITKTATNDSIIMDAYNKLRRATYYSDAKASKEYTDSYLQFAEKRKDSHNIVLAYFFLGNASLLDGSYEDALKNYLVGANYYDKKQDTARLTSVYNSLGVLHEKIEADSIALFYYGKSKALSKGRNDFRRSGIAAVNMSNIYTNQNKPAIAIPLLEEAVSDLSKNPDHISFLTIANINLAAAYRKNKQNEKSQILYEKILSQIDTTNDSYNYANVLSGLSNLYANKNQTAKAATMGEKAYQLYKKNNYNDERFQMIPDLIATYRKDKQLEKALNLYDEYQVVKDSLLNTENNESIADAIQKYETEKKDAELKVLALEKENEAKQKKIFGYLALAGVLVAGLVGFLLFRNNKKSKLLAKQKTLLEATVDEKNVLLKETHHRVKNSFQIVSSLLYLQSENIEDKEAQIAMREAQNRVRSMVLIHQKLYSKDQLVGIDTNEYFTDLVQDIFESNTDETSKIEYTLDVATLVLSIETVTPLGLILNELITNVIKHAFPKDKKDKRLHIKLQKNGETLNLEVADNGAGMASEIKDTSFGIKLMKALSKKLKAKITFEKNSPEGTKAIVNCTRFNEL